MTTTIQIKQSIKMTTHKINDNINMDSTIAELKMTSLGTKDNLLVCLFVLSYLIAAPGQSFH